MLLTGLIMAGSQLPEPPKWAYVEFYLHKSANNARKGLSGLVEVCGRELRVEWARPKPIKKVKVSGRTQVHQAPAVAPPAVAAPVEESN